MHAEIRNVCKSPNIFDEEYLESLGRLHRWHPEIAVAAGLDHCAERMIAPPAWIVRCASDVMNQLLTGSKPARRGRSCTPVARYRQDQIDYLRWDAVVSARENQPRIRERVSEMRAYASEFPARYIELEEKLANWIGHDWIRAYEVASMYLQGSYAHGGPDAVRTSYLKVQRSRSCMNRYIAVREPFRYKIDIPHPRDEQGMKCRHLFELTI
ncbi:hypothetical protein [Pseudorhodoplanes sinuspersici]|uniref:Uncharacterized protein n=1 Tax=Pseudorhodoplanes sinuspersici TaxID=1235591 RepID=A0A1W6ZMC5_9HYPH|nr:hypothetical protein [Pseudorhodoplanes sinuspersici]ARP98280.1 hypothetical protein CAK95_03640 [Pseudorhodoplanes sinuspersici]RKE65788.1 hypothetical protein DFP91_5835 [Pseudorhodoplanes sinuspersici]